MSLTNAASDRRKRMSLVEEVTRGTTPPTPAYSVIPRLEGAAMQSQRSFERSGIVRSDRMGGQQIGGTRSSDGSIPMPILKEESFKKLLESALSGTFSAPVAGAAAINGSFGGSAFTRTAGDFLLDPLINRFKVGDRIALAGTANQGTALNGAINATVATITVTSTAMLPVATEAIPQAVQIESEWITYTGKTGTTLTGCTRGAFGTTAALHATALPVIPVKKVTALTSTVMTFDSTVTTEAALNVTLTSQRRRLIAGTVRKFFTVESYYPDIDTPRFERHTGQEVNTAQFTIPTSGETQATFSMLGLGFASDQVVGSTYTDPVGNKAMAGSVKGTQLLINGAAVLGCIETLQISVNNGRNAKYGIGAEDACLIEEGDFDAELSFTMYFSDKTDRDRFQDGTRFQLEVQVRDLEDGHGYAFVFPELVYTAAPEAVSGTTITNQFTAFAEYNATYATKMVIEEFTNA